MESVTVLYFIIWAAFYERSGRNTIVVKNTGELAIVMYKTIIIEIIQDMPNSQLSQLYWWQGGTQKRTLQMHALSNGIPRE